MNNCPFCGSKCEWCDEHDNPDDHECHFIVCTGCKAQFDMSGGDDVETLEELKELCLEKFNKRNTI